MIEARAEAIIERSAEEIWSYAADIAQHPAWMNVGTAEALVGRGDRVGDRGREVLRLGPLNRAAEFTVVAAEPGKRITWRTGADAPLTGDLTLDLEPLGPASTRATYAGRFEPNGLLRWLAPIMSAEMKRGPAAELARLKAAVEREG